MAKHKPSSHQKEASKATAKYRVNNPNMPEGTQVQHWSKVLSAKDTGMSTTRMNQNLSPLQSRNDKPATTLHTSKDGSSGTVYTVHEKVLPNGELSDHKEKNGKFGNEHKFADRHLIPAETKNMKGANPNMNKQDMVEVAGGSAKWKMTGDPGNVAKHLMEKVNLSVKGAVNAWKSKMRVNSAAAKSKAAPHKPANSSAGAKSNKSSSAPKANNLRVSKAGSAAAKAATGSAKVAATPKAPSAPKAAPGGGSNTAGNV